MALSNVKDETACVGTFLPITALEFSGELLLAGEGPHLHVYDTSNLSQPPRPSFSCKVLSHQVIHGIIKGHGPFYAVFGQKAFCVIRVDIKAKSLSKASEVQEVSDWIWDICWLHSKLSSPDLNQGSHVTSHLTDDEIAERTELAIATGHNTILVWSVQKMCLLNTIHCQENCILYSARFIGQTWDDLVLAAGTVFNQVVFWRPLGPRDETDRVMVDHRFSGHQGVIFNIMYNPERQLLATVSDDRSIRLWRYNHPVREAVDQSSEADRVMYGHSARVWSARILTDSFVSVGEDATCIVWNMEGEIIKKFKSHKGKSIWSLAVRGDEAYVATGGGDCSIRLWSLKNQQFHQSGASAITTLNIQGEVNPLVKGQNDHEENQKLEADLVPRTLVISCTGQLLVMTQGGYLISWSSSSDSWQLVMHDGKYQSYSVMAAAPSTPLVAIGNIHGYLKILLLDKAPPQQTECKAYDGNVLNVIWATDSDLFSTGMDGQLIWWKVQVSPSLGLVAHGNFILPACRQRWATSVIMLDADRFVCGDRRGSVHVYVHSLQKELVGPSSSAPGVHGKAGTSYVCLHDGLVYSAGRDGSYRQYSITESGELRLTNAFKVYKGFEWLEKLVFTDDGDILVLGFHSVNFVVWSTRNNEALLTVPCGGGHRSWAFSPLDDGAFTAFVCIKMKQLLMGKISSTAWQRQTILKTDIHGREITCIKHLQTITSAGLEYNICATGSEDTKVNIIAFISPAPGGQCSSNQTAPLADARVLHRLHSHVSSVRALDSCPSVSAQDETLLFSVGGRCSINCWRIKFKERVSKVSPAKELCTVCHLASHSSLTTAKFRRRLQRLDKELDPETRFMSVSVWREGYMDSLRITGGVPGCIMMCVASSDAQIRLFCFDETECKIIPLGSSNMHDCCLLAVTSLNLTFDSEGQRGRVVLTGGTDGRIALWDVSEVEKEGVNVIRSDCRNEVETGQNDDSGDDDDDDDDDCLHNHIGGDSPNNTNNDSSDSCSNSCMDQNESCNASSHNVPTLDTLTDKLHSTAKYANASLGSGRSSQGSNAMPCSLPQSNAHSSIGDDPRTRDEQILVDGVGAEHIDQDLEAGPGTSNNLNFRIVGQVVPSSNISQATATARTKSAMEKNKSFPLLESSSSLAVTSCPAAEHSTTVTLCTNGELLEERLAGGCQVATAPGQVISAWTAFQSGVNALAVTHVTDRLWLVASGGDDTALNVALMALQPRDSSVTSLVSSILDTRTLPRSHAAQITGIKFVSPRLTFLSVSIDQRLNRWNVVLSDNSDKIQEVKLVSSDFVHVADVAGMDVWQDSCEVQYAVICGQGLQLLSLQGKHNAR